MNKRSQQKEMTKQRIIKVAMEVYAQSGFSTPTSVIATKAKVSHGTIFSHFPTVESLLSCLLDTFNQDLVLKLHGASITSDSIEELLYKHLEVLEEYEGFYKQLISQTYILPKEVYYILIEIQSGVSHHFSRVIDKEKKEGKIKNMPLSMLFNTWLGLVHYYLQNSHLFAPEGKVLNRYREILIRTYITLIKE